LCWWLLRQLWKVCGKFVPAEWVGQGCLGHAVHGYQPDCDWPQVRKSGLQGEKGTLFICSVGARSRHAGAVGFPNLKHYHDGSNLKKLLQDNPGTTLVLSY
jgi:hypothetical protein